MGGRGTGEWRLWVVAVGCALHATEEYFTGWQAWAEDTLGIIAPTWLFTIVALGIVRLARQYGGALA